MNFFRFIKTFFKERFNLEEDKADEKIIVETIRRDVHFKGPNLWAPIFAIFVASIGLNVNSTAVIIGAMLISPLMGPKKKKQTASCNPLTNCKDQSLA